MGFLGSGTQSSSDHRNQSYRGLFVVSIGTIITLTYIFSILFVSSGGNGMGIEFLLSGIMFTTLGIAELLPEKRSRAKLAFRIAYVGCGVALVILFLLYLIGAVNVT